MPNPNTIPWTHYQDIQIPDVSIREQFQSLCLQQDFASALQLLRTNEAQLHGKAYIADTINTICNGLLDLESRFNTGVLVYLSTLANKWQDLIDGIKKRGNWLATFQYHRNNFVIYNGDMYMALDEVPIGTLPTDTKYWLYLGLRGIDGANGLNVTMKYAWDRNANYAVNDLVTYKNNIYACVKPNIGVEPDKDINSWIIFVAVEVGKIHVGMTPPKTKTENTIWFHTKTDPVKQADSTPVIGQFKRYRKNQTNGYWEEMYPESLFTLLQNREYLRKGRIVDDVIITPKDWVGSTWTYKNPDITNDSIIHVYPNMDSTSLAYPYYNRLSIKVNTGEIVFTSNRNVDQDMPIKIIIG